MTRTDRPLAEPAFEAQLKKLFTLELTPEEYAARHAHRLLCFSLHDYRFSDAHFDAWIQRLGDIFFGRNGAPSVEELRQRFLSDEERAAISRFEQEEF